MQTAKLWSEHAPRKPHYFHLWISCPDSLIATEMDVKQKQIKKPKNRCVVLWESGNVNKVTLFRLSFLKFDMLQADHLIGISQGLELLRFS